MKQLLLVILISISAWGAQAVESVGSAADNEIVFMGSSTIQFWETMETDFANFKTVNLGVWGSDYADLLKDSAKLIAENPASRYVIYSGDNDIAKGDAPTDVMEKFSYLAYRIHAAQPQAHIYVISIKPCPDRRSHIPDILKANHLIQDFVSKNSFIIYVDVFSKMLDESGNVRTDIFREDGLHLNSAGYRIWADALSAQLQ